MRNFIVASVYLAMALLVICNLAFTAPAAPEPADASAEPRIEQEQGGLQRPRGRRPSGHDDVVYETAV